MQGYEEFEKYKLLQDNRQLQIKTTSDEFQEYENLQNNNMLNYDKIQGAAHNKIQDSAHYDKTQGSAHNYDKTQDIMDAIEYILQQKKIDYNMFIFKKINVVLPQEYITDLPLLEELLTITDEEINITFQNK